VKVLFDELIYCSFNGNRIGGNFIVKLNQCTCSNGSFEVFIA